MSDGAAAVQLLDPFALLASLLLGAGGAGVIGQVFIRACEIDLSRKTLWLLLAALLMGLCLWAVHLIPIIDLAHRTGRRLDLTLALGALALALCGSMLSLAATPGGSRTTRRAAGAGLTLTSGAAFVLATACLAPSAGVTLDLPVLAAGALLSSVLGGVATERFFDRQTGGDGRTWIIWAAASWVTMLAAAWSALRVAPLAGTLLQASGDVVSARAGYLLLAMIGGPLALIGVVARLTDRAARREAMLRDRHNAMHDYLTGLPNRRALNEALAETLAQAARERRRVGVVALDLDRFKPINDVHGHETGDRVLAHIARQFVEVLEPGEMIARTGGDEFVGLKRSASGPADVEAFARRLRQAALRPVRCDGLVVTVGVSLGVCLYPDDDRDQNTLLSRADLALYRAKEAAGDSICFYEPHMHEAARRCSALALELRGALGRGEFELLYQPQVTIADGRAMGFEALLRWRHPTRGLVAPAEFIPVAERSGLIWEVGAWALRTACAEAARWPAELRIAVNVSPQQINHAGFAELVMDALAAAGLEASRLELEVTEASMVLDESRALEVMGELKRIGVRLVMDDYGTGFASLSMLKRFPFDKIKVDKEFVQDVAASPQASAIMRSAMLLGEAGGVPVLAEGVETHEQMRWLAREGCLEAQGFLFGRPVPASALAWGFRPAQTRPAEPEAEGPRARSIG